jgi:hypothetical protein
MVSRWNPDLLLQPQAPGAGKISGAQGAETAASQELTRKSLGFMV